MSTTMIKKICLPSEFLYQDYKKALFQRAKEICENDCSRDYGYVLSVHKIKKIIDNYISNVNSSVIFEIELEIDNLKPEINDIFKGNVCMVFGGGLFINIKDKMKVLIPISSLNNYKFDSTKKIFQDGKNIIKENDEIKVKIIGIKYAKKNFNCFGELIE